ncbi:hypothetical protein FB45DRAFT_741681 [Roridomyces roridus]|uniref:DUF6534 domain-containing protein n=1 Tax=Roridomyces roridus TaxID=1738132 RepID=A0AAD7C189_9AGAR|nr:hypothetical protein FB45DRAFT_741681 [Roridomyces roridus]
MDIALFGCLSVQIYVYYQSFPKDRTLHKSLVYGIYALQLALTGEMIHGAFVAFGQGFGDISSLAKFQDVGYLVPIIGGLTGCASQLFYAYRIRILSRRWTVAIVVIVVRHPLFVARNFNTTQFGIWPSSSLQQVWFGGSAISDVLIAASMTYYLTRLDTGFRQTHEIVSKLMRLIIETGTMTALVALTALILFTALPDHLYYVVAAGVLPKLYSLSTLTVLNSRARIMGSQGMELSDERIISTVQFSHRRTAASESDQPAVAISRELFSGPSIAPDDLEMKAMGVCSNFLLGCSPN